MGTKILVAIVGAIIGAPVGAALGFGLAAAVSLFSMLVSPNDPSAASVGIIVIITVPGGFLYGLVGGPVVALELLKYFNRRKGPETWRVGPEDVVD